MCSSVRGIDWDDFQESMPAFVAMVTMPYTFSIGYGIIGGLVLWIAIQVLLIPVRLSRKEDPWVPANVARPSTMVSQVPPPVPAPARMACFAPPLRRGSLQSSPRLGVQSLAAVGLAQG
eukprot:g1578.t1